MKISVITLHRVTNFGSLLQTYATETILERLGHDVTIIDFVPDGLTFKRAIWPKKGNTLIKILKFLPLMICNLFQYHMSDKFLKENTTLTPKRYYNYTDLASEKFDTDIFISGSDQVWNTQNNNPDADLGAYYLQFAEGKIKIAYAGSFGRTEFSNDEKQKICFWLKQYKSISVREDKGLTLIEEMGIHGKHVVDPTFLLNRNDWIEFYLSKRTEFPHKGYVFVYNLNRNKLLKKIAIKVAEKYNLRIINFADTFEFIPKAYNKLFNTPFDFLGYLINADYVITDSFHGTCFSINLEKQFITVAAPKYNVRIESVLRMMHCESRLIISVEEAIKKCEKQIDYKIITPLVNNNRCKSLQFLENSINECKYNWK